MKESRSELQELFKSFMLAGKISMQDDKKYEQFQQLIKETKEKLQQFREEK